MAERTTAFTLKLEPIDNVNSRRVYKIEDSSGKTITEVVHKFEAGHYQVSWSNQTISAVDFFHNAIGLTDKLRSRFDIPFIKKLFSGLDIGLMNNDLIELDARALDIDERLQSEDLFFARYNTSYGDFIWLNPQYHPEGTENLVFLTHVLAPSGISDLIIDTSQHPQDREALVMVLGAVGAEAQIQSVNLNSRAS